MGALVADSMPPANWLTCARWPPTSAESRSATDGYLARTRPHCQRATLRADASTACGRPTHRRPAIPFCCCATDVVSGQETVFSHGPLRWPSGPRCPYLVSSSRCPTVSTSMSMGAYTTCCHSTVCRAMRATCDCHQRVWPRRPAVPDLPQEIWWTGKRDREVYLAEVALPQARHIAIYMNMTSRV